MPLRPPIYDSALNTLRHYGKLPFVEYSVVKYQMGLTPQTPGGRYAGTPNAPLRVRRGALCAPWDHRKLTLVVPVPLGAAPQTPGGRYAGTPSAPLRRRRCVLCTPWGTSALVRVVPLSLGAFAPNRRPVASATVQPTGGEYRARTGDLLVANQALSQLS